mgnify:CR=1 FL=1
MKILLISLLITIFSSSKTPEGIWVHKEDTSRIEIYEVNGKLSGKLISSRNPFLETNIEVLKNLEYKDGKWQGELYIPKKKRWVQAILEEKNNLLIIELDLGYDMQKFHLYRE